MPPRKPYTIPSNERQKAKRIQQERKAAAKKLARSLKRSRKKRKTGVSSPVNYETGNPESTHLETSGEETEIEEDINLHHSSCNETSASQTQGQQVNQQTNSSKASKQNENDRTPQKESSPTKKNPLLNESKKLSNIAKTGQGCSQSNPDNKMLHKAEQAKAKFNAENKEIAEKEALKPIKCMKCETNNVKHNSKKKKKSKRQRKLHEDLISKTNMIQQKIEKKETDMKYLDEQDKNIVSLAEEKKIMVSGDIKILAADKLVRNNDSTGFTYSFYNPDTKIMNVGDDDIKISIRINDGIQVVCNSRKRPVVDLVQNVETFLAPLEVHATARTDDENKTYPEIYDETTSDSKCDTSKYSRNCQTIDDQVLNILDAGTIVNLEQADESAIETKCNSNSISKPSMGSFSSARSLVQQKIENVCEGYINSLITQVFEKFGTRVENYIERD